jgi:nucleotide-binding universal stress UspA family protein
MNASHSLESNGILLAIDGSHEARSAALAAIQIASHMKWKLHAQYVVDVISALDMYNNISPELSELGHNLPDERKVVLMEDQGMLALADIEALCKDQGLSMETEMIAGDIGDVILKSSEKYNLLALGRRGNRHEEDPHHLGSNFRHIAHHAHHPLLIGGSEEERREYHRLLLAYDGSEFSRQALAWVEKLQSLFLEVLVLSVKTQSEKDISWLEDRQKEIAESTLKQWKFIGEEGDAGAVIAATASAQQADLILMGAYHHVRLLEWATHSTLNGVLTGADIPVLAIK